MTNHPTPPPIPPLRMLTPTAGRGRAASMIQAADRAVPAALIADMLDATAAAVLRVAGVDARPDAWCACRCGATGE